MKYNSRTLHRDLGYFFIGLIISFSFSGILQNHRNMWHPEKYVVETKQVSTTLPTNENEINEDFAKDLMKKWGIEDKFRRINTKENIIKISLEKHDIELNKTTGKGEMIVYKKTPFISHTMKLHMNSSNWWIYYSDIFAIALIVIAVTGTMMYKKGEQSFSKKGWKLALAGLIFPLIFLFFLS
ncbi:MAG: PepSY-associated TM helix domain-containing protein [Pseudarcicella sp.]|nr:PepSY-associated TM helix domain-containing protein [Pseudarcicella sp.]MBP6409738.1 PepSY-associated TM helix domain-containing protein [Pseudarcicella sp.]